MGINLRWLDIRFLIILGSISLIFMPIIFSYQGICGIIIIKVFCSVWMIYLLKMVQISIQLTCYLIKNLSLRSYLSYRSGQIFILHHLQP